MPPASTTTNWLATPAMLEEPQQSQRWGKLPQVPFLAMALDIGTRKIGVATGHSLIATTTPQTAIKADQATPNWPELEALLKKWQPQLVVVGWPLNMDGSETFLTAACERAANKIHGRYNIAVRCVDERLSTREAYEIALSDPDANWKNKPVDAIAAAVILDSWFQSRQA